MGSLAACPVLCRKLRNFMFRSSSGSETFRLLVLRCALSQGRLLTTDGVPSLAQVCEMHLSAGSDPSGPCCIGPAGLEQPMQTFVSTVCTEHRTTTKRCRLVRRCAADALTVRCGGSCTDNQS